MTETKTDTAEKTILDPAAELEKVLAQYEAAAKKAFKKTLRIWQKDVDTRLSGFTEIHKKLMERLAKLPPDTIKAAEVWQELLTAVQAYQEWSPSTTDIEAAHSAEKLWDLGKASRGTSSQPCRRAGKSSCPGRIGRRTRKIRFERVPGNGTRKRILMSQRSVVK
jgi:hypothetical protein